MPHNSYVYIDQFGDTHLSVKNGNVQERRLINKKYITHLGPDEGNNGLFQLSENTPGNSPYSIITSVGNVIVNNGPISKSISQIVDSIKDIM